MRPETVKVRLLAGAVCLILSGLVSAPAGADTGAGWSHYGGDAGGTRYSTAGQITPENVNRLEVAWTYHTGEMERRGPALTQNSSSQNTPIIVGGNVIICTSFNRIIALDPASGLERWVFDAEVDLSHALPFHYNCRGVVSWQDPAAPEGGLCALRIILPTNDARLISIDSATGQRCEAFGDNGEISVPQTVMPLWPGELKLTSAPVVLNGVLITGSIVMDNLRADAPAGTVFAFDARSGAIRWTFDPVPRDPLDPAYASWGEGSAEKTGAANVWSTMVIDAARDLVFVPTSSAAPDFWGGERPGNNLYSSALVVLRGSTGEVVWHQQLVHHDIWDFDVASPPMLVDIERDGRTVPAVVQNTKQGFVFVFDRRTGAPLFPIEEKPVPQSALAGEWLSPTQPFVPESLRLLPTEVTEKDAWGFSFYDRAVCREKIAALKNEGMFTPPSTAPGTLLPQGNAGGANWGGPTYDPNNRLMIININNIPQVVELIPREQAGVINGVKFTGTGAITEQRHTPFAARTSWLLSPFGAPCIAPPWGELVAVDLDKGEVRWRAPLGSMEYFLPIPFKWNLGTPNIGGPISTAGGVTFIGAAMDQYFRAFATATGEELWRYKMPAGQSTTPITYEAAGRQFVLMVTGHHLFFGAPAGDQIIAFALPAADPAP